MTNIEFVQRAKSILSLNTLYVNGCWGAPMNAKNKTRYTNNTTYNKQTDRTMKILNASSDTFGFDCVGLIKGILWGFKGDASATYGGATYKLNNIPDLPEDTLIQLCKPSSDFSKLEDIGTVVWMKGHIGIYIGDNLVIESSPKWTDGVQITSIANKGGKAGFNSRTWAKWGKLPYITYEDTEMVKQLDVLCNGKRIKVDAINKDGTNYIKLRDLDTKLCIVSVGWDGVLKLPIIDKK